MIELPSQAPGVLELQELRELVFKIESQKIFDELAVCPSQVFRVICHSYLLDRTLGQVSFMNLSHIA